MDKRLPFTGYNPKLKERSKMLRRNMTPEEKHLWYDHLNHHAHKFYRQRPIDWYIADFYCSAAKLVIELDGHQHFTEEGRGYDEVRTKILEIYGLRIIRFTNRDVWDNFAGVCALIDYEVAERVAVLEQARSEGRLTKYGTLPPEM